ncbi:type 1 glutamine amidotransferase [Haloechinothrix sp. YIM 98757]|uniref:Type 1 glutamine amidotransferase n=1 Tax=Haloechinothrix aidingensis TaxID=2752311 RepID=A0A838A771_9PSEU|nr:type 1 glutamine amidotransferase domain-containing protein [Haloechinothrix aidingensis]MBA0124905.1 type 1 glutamine amidotransferase [Haloechinothrix aidingensis]
MSTSLSGTKVAFLVAHEGVEQVELTSPWDAVRRAGGTPELISTRRGTVQAFHHLDKAGTFDADRLVDQARPEDYGGLVLPGGVANPDALRLNPHAVRLAHDFVAHHKPVAAICHAPWLLIEAGVVADRRLTSYPSLATDLRNAGARWSDDEIVVDSGLVTSRKPDDLPAFCAKLVEEVAEGAHGKQARSA